MELDELKSLLGTQHTAERSSEQISAYLKIKSKSVLNKIERSMKIELAFAIIFGSAAVVWFFMSDLAFYKLLAATVSLFCGGFFIYVYDLRKRITRLEHSSQPVKKNLEEIIRILELFTRLYFQLTMIVLPLICVMGLLALRYDKILALSLRDWIFYFGWFILWSLFMYYFTKWYLKLFYGNYLKELKEQLRELTDN